MTFSNEYSFCIPEAKKHMFLPWRTDKVRKHLSDCAAVTMPATSVGSPIVTTTIWQPCPIALSTRSPSSCTRTLLKWTFPSGSCSPPRRWCSSSPTRSSDRSLTGTGLRWHQRYRRCIDRWRYHRLSLAAPSDKLMPCVRYDAKNKQYIYNTSTRINFCWKSPHALEIHDGTFHKRGSRLLMFFSLWKIGCMLNV